MFEVALGRKYTSRTMVFCYMSLQNQIRMGGVEAAEKPRGELRAAGIREDGIISARYDRIFL